MFKIRLPTQKIAGALLLCAIGAKAATSVKTPRVHAQLVSTHTQVAPGDSFYFGVLFKIIPEWHIYWKNPGDSGEAPNYNWKTPENFKVSEIFWPAPKRIPLAVFANYGYEHEILLPVKVSLPSATPLSHFNIQLEASWLVCKEECIPESGTFAFNGKISSRSVENTSLRDTFDKYLALVPRELKGEFYFEGDLKKGITAKVPIEPLKLSQNDYDFKLYPVDAGVFEAGVELPTQHSREVLSFSFKPSDQTLKIPEKLSFVLSATPKVENSPKLSYEFVASTKTSVAVGFWWALLGAFVGGLILNLMPCVLPVLSLKAFSILESFNDPSKSLKKEGFAYFTGVLVSFWILALVLLVLRAGGEGLGWGFQLQNPLFVLAMFWLFVVLALNFFGVFDFGESIQAWSGRFSIQSKSSLGSSFFSGILATIIATPCTAPFMGSAVGLALGLPALQSLAIFTSLGCGMALPLLILFLFPSTLKFLPKPGAWMESFKQFMGFPMLGTSIWLLWVFGLQRGLDSVTRALFTALVLALALWFLKRAQNSLSRILLISLSLVVFVGIAKPLIRSSSTSESSAATGDYSGLDYESYSRERLQSALSQEKRLVYVDYTAAWCLSCQVNKQVVFSDDEVKKVFREKRVLILKADWTNKNAELLKELESFGRSGVPLNLLYSPARPQNPHIFEALLQPSTVLDAIQQVSRE